MGVPIAILSIVVVPHSAPRPNKPSWRRLDLGGVSLITSVFISLTFTWRDIPFSHLYYYDLVSVVLFIFAVTSGSADVTSSSGSGWGKAKVIAPLVISILMAAVFFVYEAKIDPQMAALPPRVWFYPNVPILAALGLVPFFWWVSCMYSIPNCLLP